MNEMTNTTIGTVPSIKTAFTEKFGVPYPILNAGMGWIALPPIVAAVSNAGGLGVFGAGSQPPELVRERIREIRKMTDKPFGINCPLALPNALENAKVAIEEQVAVINYSMGKGDWIANAVAKYGGKTIASVNSVKLAQSAEKHGADAVIAAGYEAAGHAGDIGVFVLVQRLAEVTKLPVIAAGGQMTGASLMGTLALGGSAVSMGTRFAYCKESPMATSFKEYALTKDVQDTIFSSKFDGFPNRLMLSKQSQNVASSAVNPISAFFYSFSVAKELNIPYPTLLLDVLKKGPVEAVNMMRMAQMLKYNKLSFEENGGDLVHGMSACGQSVGLMHDSLSASDIVQQIVREAVEARAKLDTLW